MALVGSGLIGPGGVEFFDVVLQAQQTYHVYVRPVEIGVDFDLRVLDENGNVVQQDTSTAADAHCAITPAWTGPFRLIVNSVRGMSAYQIEVQD